MSKAAAKRAEAGLRGEDIRSDLWVSVEPADSGGLDVSIESKVAALFGDSIREAVESVASAFGVTDAHIEIEDKGAQPHVIEARLEAAFRVAGYSDGGTLTASSPAPPSTERDRLRRSRLYLPATEPKFMINAGLHRPDAVILDLEDSVHPDHKYGARLVVRNALRSIDFGSAERMVRINQLPLGLEDLDEVVKASPDLILIPKTESADDVRAVQERITAIQERLGVDRPIWLMPILESALGIERAFEIAEESEHVVALTIGLEDYTADLGVVKTVEGTESLYARQRLVNAARAAGIQPIDSVFGDVEDMAGLTDWARRSRALGFEGMGCIHPRQIRPIHKAFVPSSDEIEKALAIVAAFEEAQSKGLGVVSLGTRMIDPPVVLRAQRLVSAARKSGFLEDTNEVD